MGRNCIYRYIEFTPAVKGFKPLGRGMARLQSVVLSLDEYEAIRLLDYEHQNQEAAAVQMRISRPTLTRIYEKARVKYATALVEGCLLLIEGGDVQITNHLVECPSCHKRMPMYGAKPAQCPHCKPGDGHSIGDHHSGRGRQMGCKQKSGGGDKNNQDIYEYSHEGLATRKQALETELLWINQRINELEENK